MLHECLAVRTTIAMYTPTRTPPRRDALQKAVEEADKGSAIRRRAAEAAATAGALRIRERKMAQDKCEEAQSHALGEYTRRGYEPPSSRVAATLSFSSSSSDDEEDPPEEKEEKRFVDGRVRRLQRHEDVEGLLREVAHEGAQAVGREAPG